MVRDDVLVAPEIVPPSGTVTFLFTDIEGSTRLWEADPEGMREALARHDVLLRDAVVGRGGVVFKTTGDGLCAAFGEPGSAVGAAIDAQLALGSEEWGDVGPLAVRMGVHTGVAESRDGDYFGRPLNVVGRLHSAAHGGQIVVSEATAMLLGSDVELLDLGQVEFRGVEAPVGVWQVLASGIGATFPALRSVVSTGNNLPLAVDSFIGRGAEMADLQGLVRRSRLVTVTGAGGTGKTRLATEVAARLAPDFADGAWVVELAPLDSGDAVAFAVGDVLGIRQRAGVSMVEALGESLGSRQLLMVLDNCEHVLDEVARVCEVVTKRCPNVHLVATSREGLAVRGEQIFALRSMGATEAVDLFVQRAVAAGADLSPENKVAQAIAARLEGMPLAIELAAARVPALGVDEVERRLDEQFRLLRGSRRSRVERHQTLWNTIAWSVDLLNDTERDVFAGLAVFAGSFSLRQAAGVLASGLGLDELDVEDALEGLVSKSLVLAEPGPAGDRYRLLEAVRQFGSQQLVDTGNAEWLAERHCEVFAEVALLDWEQLRGPEGVTWSRVLEADIDNLRAACTTANQIGRPELGWTVVGSIGLWASLRGQYEVADWADLRHDGPQIEN